MDTEINDENITDISNNITLATIQTSNIYSDINSNEFNNLNSITIEYFSNTGFYNKYLNKSEIEKYISKSDKKFYKKRIINETKKMLKDEFETDTLREIFNKYIFSLISHFKIMDTTEIIQKNFDSTDSNSPDILDSSFISIMDISLSNPNQLLYKTETKTLTMDNFINKKPKQKELQHFPLKKNINLREPEFKTKGIKKKEKKENIDNV